MKSAVIGHSRFYSLKGGRVNTDEKFNYYVDELTRLQPSRASNFERCLSEMLGAGCTPTVVWYYAEKEMRIAREDKYGLPIKEGR
jgi:hypothetical protein